MADTKVDPTQLKAETLDSHYIKLTKATTQNIATGSEDTPVTLAWDNTLIKSPNTTSFHNTASLNGRIYPQIAGAWLFTGQVRFEANSNGFRVLRLELNGASKGHVSIPAHGTNNQRIQVSAMVNITSVGSQYIELAAGHNSGSTLTISGGEDDTWIYGLLVRRT